MAGIIARADGIIDQAVFMQQNVRLAVMSMIRVARQHDVDIDRMVARVKDGRIEFRCPVDDEREIGIAVDLVAS